MAFTLKSKPICCSRNGIWKVCWMIRAIQLTQVTAIKHRFTLVAHMITEINYRPG